MKKNEKQLLIIDGNAVIHRSFHALPPTLRTKEGKLVNAVYGFTSFLLKSITEFEPEYIILTLDKAGPTFRHEAYTEYKATRVKAVDELYEQIPLVKEVANTFGVPIFEKSGFEADDIIGTISKKTGKIDGLNTIIMTGDMDTLQLINDKVKVYTMSRGLSQSVIYDAEKVEERYGLSPKQIIDFKALSGDSSDNIPGAKGIGEKTATSLLQNFKSIEGVYQALDKKDERIKDRTAKLLQESKDNVFLSYQLASIDCDMSLDFNLEEAEFSLSNTKPIYDIFSKLEFTSLLNRVKALINNEGDDQVEGKTNDKNNENKLIKIEQDLDYKYLENKDEIADALKRINKEKAISLKLHIEEEEKGILGLAIALENKKTYYLPKQNDNFSLFKDVLENKNLKKISYDFKTDIKLLQKEDIKLNGLEFDILIAAYLLNPGHRGYNLGNLLFTELGIEKTEKRKKKNGDNSEDKEKKEQELKSFSSAVSCLNDLKQKLEERLKQEKLTSIFKQLEMPLLEVLTKMEINGIKVDSSIIEDLEKKTKKKIKGLEKNIYSEANKEFNINSTKQLREILFVDLEIPTTGIKKTKTGFSTAEDELLKMEKYHPIIPFILQYRELSKFESTYLSVLPKLVNPKTGRIHTHFSQITAATGRLSSHDPNLQNIPTKTEEGRLIRKAFISKPGYLLCGFDYSQIELRLAAHFSQDEEMIKAFQDKADIHSQTAASINGVTLAEVSSKMRQEAKAINFGILYGQGPHGLSQSAGISYSEAKKFIDKYFLAYPKIKQMVDNFITQAEDKGYASTLMGRKRSLSDINSSMPMLRKAAQRMAINTPIQGTAADIIKKAMLDVDQYIKGKEDEINMLLQVHDELIFEIKEDRVNDYIDKITDIMQDTIKLDVDILVESQYGKTWYDLK